MLLEISYLVLARSRSRNF